jgi:putative glycosyltransferase (TIGR04372 family)
MTIESSKNSADAYPFTSLKGAFSTTLVKWVKKFRRTVFGAAIVHAARFLLIKSYREHRSLLSPSPEFYYSRLTWALAQVATVAFPVYLILRKKRVFLSVNNIATSVGHVYAELDWLSRKAKREKIWIIYCYPAHEIIRTVNRMRSVPNVTILESGILSLVFYLTALRFPEITVDCSISAIDHLTRVRRSFADVMCDRYSSYCRLRALTADYYPLRSERALSKELLDFIGSSSYAVIQIKTDRVNATFHPTDSKSLHSSIEFLVANGISVVFAGRERMPQSFEALGVLNYSESRIASAINDYLLLLNCKLAITSASGFTFLADVLDIPVLSINNFFISSFPGRKTIYIPSILCKDELPVGMINQYFFGLSFGNILPSRKLPEGYTVSDATGDQVYNGVRDLMSFVDTDSIPPLTPRQKTFKSLFVGYPIGYELSRISDSFLKFSESWPTCASPGNIRPEPRLVDSTLGFRAGGIS